MKKEIVVFLSQNSMDAADQDQAAAEFPRVRFAPLNLALMNVGRSADIVSDNLRTERTRLERTGVVDENVKVLVARGYNATCLKQIFPSLNVIELTTTSFDILRAIPAGFRGRAAVITTGMEVLGLDLIAQRCAINIIDWSQTNYSLVPETIKKAVSLEQVDLVIGGASTRNLADKCAGKPIAVQIRVGPESLRRAISEARQVLEAIREEAEEQRYMASLMDTLTEGVVSVREGIIHAINATAEKLIGGERAYLIGCPDSLLPADLFLNEDEESKVLSFRGADLLVRRVRRHGEPGSYTLSLHEHDALSRMEHSVRLKISHTGSRYSFKDISGMSQQITRTIGTAKDYAHSDANILILGESGCGKEMFAQSIHYESARRDKPFLAVNCAGFTRELLQSELFGYVAGSFTGASRQGKAGIFEIAHEGTVFLDEIAEMDFSLQASLLRVLQEQYVVRLGSYAPIPVDVRLIAATNKNLAELVREGKFRDDLYYRLNVLPLDLPPLRERGRDAEQLLSLFLRRSGGNKRFALMPEAQKLILQYQWPGNVRELMNVAQRLAVTTPGGRITEEMLRRVMNVGGMKKSRSSAVAAEARIGRKQSQLEAIREAVSACDGNLGEAAKRLGISRSTLWRRIKRFEEA